MFDGALFMFFACLSLSLSLSLSLVRLLEAMFLRLNFVILCYFVPAFEIRTVSLKSGGLGSSFIVIVVIASHRPFVGSLSLSLSLSFGLSYVCLFHDKNDLILPQ